MNAAVLALAIVLGSLVLALNAWGMLTTYHKLVDTVPGWSRRSSKTPPSILATGRPQPVSEPQRGPLSDRPCAAWRLSVVCRKTTALGGLRFIFDRYSGGSFSLVTADTEVPIRLIPCEHTIRSPTAFPRHAPPWLLPRVDPARGFTMEVYHGVPTLPLLHDLSKAQASAACEAAAAELQRYDLGRVAPDEQILVIETIVDLETTWVCEGPSGSDLNPGIVARPETTSSYFRPNAVKLTRLSDLSRITRRVMLRELGFFIFFDIFVVLVPALTLIAQVFRR
ncbi:hypothetical protein ENSA5_08810 [Enhygromyxa salina]|uniref:Uncharacterized protein n=1 Tax=Enhygromyxa salina TaxID=215803 RepID=A0A2S9YGS5_9BACT|nr:hypothetical protein [Enhygromyxa salina]PRQ04315.1 hypothetical protein ENSA5_08810 [Enhygromyxa salina]